MSITRLVGQQVRTVREGRLENGVVVGQLDGRKLVIRVLGTGLIQRSLIEEVQFIEQDPVLSL